MNTQEIDNLVRQDRAIQQYRGVFAIDLLPRIDNGTYIVNTSPHYISQGHWVCIAKKRFFCSYGMHPHNYGIIGAVEYNAVQLQSDDSSVCGLYAVLAASLLNRNYELEEIVTVFTTCVHTNDLIVKMYFNE